MYYEAKEYAKALAWIRQAADQGVPVALYTLGLMAQEGQGMAPNASGALGFFERAAVLGQEDAQYAVVRHWDAALAGQRDPLALEAIASHLEGLQQGLEAPFLEKIILRAQDQAALSRKVEANAREAKNLPPGRVVLALQLLDMPPEEGGLPLANEAWQIFAAFPSEPPDGYPTKEAYLAEGILDLQGCTHLDSTGARRLREALDRGATLVFAWPGQRRLLEPKPRPRGGLTLELGSKVHF